MRALNLLSTPPGLTTALTRGAIPTLLFAFVAASVGCGVSAEPFESGSVQQAIVRGVDAEMPEGVVNVGGGGAQCSATLIAPNLLLTAMHCVVAKALVDDFQCMSDGTISKGTEGAGDLGQLADPTHIQARGNPVNGKFPVYALGKQLFTTNSSHVCHDDLALVLLDKDLDLPLTPVRLDAPTVEGELITVVGFGRTENASSSVARRKVSNIEVLAVGGSGKSGAADPAGVITPRSVAQANTFATGPAGCKGDSGGPAISEETGAVVGVFSIFMNDCASPSAIDIYTRAAPFKGLILSALEAAGYPAWYEGTGAAGDPAPVPAVTAPEPEPEPSTAEPEEEAPAAQRQRLSSGCSTRGASNTKSGAYALLLFAAAFWRRRSVS